MSGRLQDKTAIVVGAGQRPGETLGNGRAIALRFAAEGATLFCVDRDGERARETAALIVERGGKAFHHTADVTSEEQCASMAEAALAALGHIDILVNNVGIGAAGDGPLHLTEERAWDLVIAVNLKSCFLATKHVLPAMRARKRGAIVNVASLAAIAGAHQLAYEVSKAGVNRITAHVALGNAKHGVRCNAILLGLVDTPMAVGGIAAASGRPVEEVRAERNARVPLAGGMGSAEDTANAALFLASDEARFVTGAVLPVDGGMSVRIG
jgi:NAD(P)-dependent dehydrogenase (short-subunit alcohol dehydrogenase family)